MLFILAVGNQLSVKKVNFYWSLALAALKNVSANSSKTATIELMCTSEPIFSILLVYFCFMCWYLGLKVLISFVLVHYSIRRG
jgi:hypothetical protein